MAEVFDNLVTQIEQVIFWLTVIVYCIFGVCIAWIIGFVRRILGLDAQSIELRRIRRILENQSSEK
jgi:hypothetical protein